MSTSKRRGTSLDGVRSTSTPTLSSSTTPSPSVKMRKLGHFFGEKNEKPRIKKVIPKWGGLLNQELIETLEKVDDVYGYSEDCPLRTAQINECTTRAPPWCSMHYEPVFNDDRRLPGAGERYGNQPHSRLDPIRSYNWAGAKVYKSFYGAAENLQVIAQSALDQQSRVFNDGEVAYLSELVKHDAVARGIVGRIYYSKQRTFAPLALLVKKMQPIDATVIEEATNHLVPAGLTTFDLQSPTTIKEWQQWIKLLETSTIVVLKSACRVLAVQNRADMDKRAMIHALLKPLLRKTIANTKGTSYSRRLYQHIGVKSLWLSPNLIDALDKAHICFFTARCYNAEEASTLLRQPFTTFPYACSPAKQKCKQAASAITFSDVVELNKAVKASLELEEGTAAGDTSRVFRVLHEITSKLMSTQSVLCASSSTSSTTTQSTTTTPPPPPLQLKKTTPRPTSSSSKTTSTSSSSSSTSTTSTSSTTTSSLSSLSSSSSTTTSLVMSSSSALSPSSKQPKLNETVEDIVRPQNLNVRYGAFVVLQLNVETVLRGVGLLEKEDRYSEALHYLHIVLPKCATIRQWRSAATRICIVLDRGLGNKNRALAAYQATLRGPIETKAEDCLHEYELAAQRGINRLQVPPRSWKRPDFKVLTAAPEFTLQSPKSESTDEIRGAWLCGGKEFHGVENLVGHHFLTFELDSREIPSSTWKCMHAENGVWSTICGVLFWPVLFGDDDNNNDHDNNNNNTTTTATTANNNNNKKACVLDYQDTTVALLRSQLDHTAVEERLKLVEGGKSVEMLQNVWTSQHPRCARGVDWERNSLEELCALVNGVGATAVASLCKGLLLDYSAWIGGLADLVLWGEDRAGKPHTLFVEVKGPGDKLSDAQRCWNARLIDAGAHVEVWHVRQKK